MAVTWAPTLIQVAACIPSRTVNKSLPGDDRYLNTFTADTDPTDTQAQAIIDRAVEDVLNGVAAVVPALESAARNAAMWRAAADIELAYPDRTADIDIYTKLDERADDEWKLLLSAAQSLGGSDAAVNPVWYMPTPVSWGDTNL